MVLAMASFSSRQRFPVSVDALFNAHVDPRFQEEKWLALGATTARASRKDEVDGTIVVEIYSSQPARWGNGEANAGTMIYRLDPTSQRGTWTRIQKGFEKKSRAEGTIVFLSDGEGRSKVKVDGIIEIRVPLMGKLIERKIVSAIASEERKEEATATTLLLRRQAASTAGEES